MVLWFNTLKEETSMGEVVITGVDLVKNSFQLQGARANGSVAFRRKLRRTKVLHFSASHSCRTVAMEACGGAHD